MLFILSTEDPGYGREFSEKEGINFCCYSSHCLPFLLKVASGSGYVDCVMARFPELHFLPLHNQKRVARLKSNKNHPHVTEEQPSIKERTWGKDEALGFYPFESTDFSIF